MLFSPPPRVSHAGLSSSLRTRRHLAYTIKKVFALDAEGNVEDFISGTNWRLPAPIWNDGSDDSCTARSCQQMGWTMSRFVKIDDATGKPVVLPHQVAATVIDVVVR